MSLVIAVLAATTRTKQTKTNDSPAKYKIDRSIEIEIDRSLER